MPHLFDAVTLRGLTLRNRIMMSPMCQYVAESDGRATDWHMVHYGSRAVGGVGLVMIEATAVEPRGRISAGDLGLWEDGQIEPLARIAAFCHTHGAAVGVQLGHAGRKAWSSERGQGPEAPVAPSAIAFDEGWRTPEALDEAGIETVTAAFGRAAARALEAGLDVIEIHGAHGYLVSAFLSPLANRREDAYGGSHAGRARFAARVADAIRGEWPESKPLFIRLSCTDWAEGGNQPSDAALFGRLLAEHGVDLVDCSSGGVVSVRPPASPGYQVPFAACVRAEGEVPTAAVGLITRPEQADAIIASGQADLVALGRALLRSPYWAHYAAHSLGVASEWPGPYRTIENAPAYPEN
jgi:2,4-dienoyl-CoA reductase-like NADH-dependent reductase (Old Yellow Enzyme family)